MHVPLAELLTLPPLERTIITQLMREGATTPAQLAVALKQEMTAVDAALCALIAQQRVHQAEDGAVALAAWHTRRRTLPARLWPALTTADRLFSAQEIATLRTIVPMVQFARARLGEFTDHGPGHVLRVKRFARQLGAVVGLTATEQHLLTAAALFHDVGNVVDRARHHLISQETVERLAANGQIPFSLTEAKLVGLLCRWHRKDYDSTQIDRLQGEAVRTGLLASLLRVADALDSDYRRFDYSDKFLHVLQFFYPHELPFWHSLAEIQGIRIHCSGTQQGLGVTLQLFLEANADPDENIQIQALRQDLADTPLDWQIQIIQGDGPSPAQTIRSSPTNSARPASLIIFPVEPHSLIMAALSRKHLRAAGYIVDLLAYPDAHDGSSWLWQDGVTPVETARLAHIVVIGVRPDEASTAAAVARLSDWQQAGVQCTLLNRHEGSWAHLPALLATGATATLGGDWAYFWGDSCDASDLFWSRLASTCSRDPSQATLATDQKAEAVRKGLLHALFTNAQQKRVDANWAAALTPLLDRIAGDERSWFVAQAAAFDLTFTKLPGTFDRQGHVLSINLPTSTLTTSYFWALEEAIEADGRLPVRGLCFAYPYAIATWPAGDGIDLLAISHWREEEAIPIRLLYPDHLGPAPSGNECALWVHLAAAQAEQIVPRLVAACNEQGVSTKVI